jgi:aryl-alcohol dehydrogenase-like predicted oxidoreductase
MNYRTFGRTNWSVSELGYGMWGMAGWAGSDDDESLKSLQLAVDSGCNFFDTAWAYGGGKSEALLGQIIRSNSEKKLYTATKIPPKNFRWPSRRSYRSTDCFPPEHIEQYVEDSLKNAGIGSFDLMQFHTWEDSWLEDEKMVRKMIDLKSQGLFKAIGISINRWEPWNGINAVETGFADAVQVIFNIFDQNPKEKLFPACKKHNVGVIARVPFDEGSLTGTLTKESKWARGDWRNTYFVPENLNATVDRVDRLKPLVPHGMSMAEMALRFILSENSVSTIIPGMRKIKNVKMNVDAINSGSLDSSLISELQKHSWERKPTEWSQ